MNTPATTLAFSVSGSKPAVLMAHTIAREYELVGITSKEFMDKHTGMDFNLTELRRAFKLHCDDYMEDLVDDVKSKAVEFCSKVIYEVGPESRKVRKGTGDKVWKFVFTRNDDQTKHFVFIATYKQENAEFKPESNLNTMVLSLKQAALLVHETLARLVVFGMSQSKILLTPLAGACFCKEDLPKLAESLEVPLVNLLISINQSTQGGGHYLSHSDIDIAICAAHAATRNVKDENLKKNIVVKLIKQYMTQGMQPNKDRIKLISRYATGGVPVEYSYENINDLITSEQKTFAALKAKKIEKESTVNSIVDVPSGSK